MTKRENLCVERDPATTQKGNLQEHMNQMHIKNDIINANLKETYYKWKSCIFVTLNKNNFEIHIKAKHEHVKNSK